MPKNRDATRSPAAAPTSTRLRDAMQAFTMRANAAVNGAALSAGTARMQRRQQPRAAVTPRAAAIDAVTFDGAKTDGATLALKTARAEVARGLVHKYVVMVRQNARRVSIDIERRATVDGWGCGCVPKP
jgi:large subunit ribosomal protein L4